MLGDHLLAFDLACTNREENQFYFYLFDGLSSGHVQMCFRKWKHARHSNWWINNDNAHVAERGDMHEFEKCLSNVYNVCFLWWVHVASINHKCWMVLGIVNIFDWEVKFSLIISVFNLFRTKCSCDSKQKTCWINRTPGVVRHHGIIIAYSNSISMLVPAILSSRP